jgi:hypothetical protein
MRFALLALAVTCTGCSMMRPSTAVVQAASDWRSVATDADRARLRDWRGTFAAALASARADGHGDGIAREGAFLDPDSAIGGPIPSGLYRCRVVKVGAKTAAMPNYRAFPWATCRVQQQGKLQRFAKLDGSQREIGVIFPYDQLHSVFLGTLMLADEARAMPYGVDANRNVIGFVERVGPQRWRLVMPKPAFESQLDVMELVPRS